MNSNLSLVKIQADLINGYFSNQQLEKKSNFNPFLALEIWNLEPH